MRKTEDTVMDATKVHRLRVIAQRLGLKECEWDKEHIREAILNGHPVGSIQKCLSEILSLTSALEKAREDVEAQIVGAEEGYELAETKIERKYAEGRLRGLQRIFSLFGGHRVEQEEKP